MNLAPNPPKGPIRFVPRFAVRRGDSATQTTYPDRNFEITASDCALNLVATARLVSTIEVQTLFVHAGCGFEQDPSGGWHSDQIFDVIETDFEMLDQVTIEAIGQFVISLLGTAKDAREFRIVPPKNPQTHRYLRRLGFYTCIEESIPRECAFRIMGPPVPIATLIDNDIVPFTWIHNEIELQNSVLTSFRKWAAFIEDPIGQFRISTMVSIIKSVFPQAELRNHEQRQPSVLVSASHFQRDFENANIEFYLSPSFLNYLSIDSDTVIALFNRRYRDTHQTITWYEIDRAVKTLSGQYTLRFGQMSFTRKYNLRPAAQEVIEHTVSLAGAHLTIELELSPGRSMDVTYAELATQIDYQRFALGSAAHTQIVQAIFEGLPWKPGEDIVLMDVGAVAVDNDSAASIVRSIVEYSHPHRTAIIGLRLSESQIAEVCEIVNAYFESAIIDGGYYQPVLVIGSTFNTTYWAGSTPEMISALNSSAAIRPHDVFRLGGYEIGTLADGCYYLSLTAANIYKATNSDYRNNVIDNTNSRDNIVYVPPALELIPAWIDVRAVLDSFAGGHTGLACLLTTEIENCDPQIIELQPSLICEEIVTDEFARVLASSLRGSLAGPNSYQRVRPRDIESSRRLSLDHNRPVVILVGVLGSGQTARQLIALAIRQNYRVMGVAALADVRVVNSGTVDLWERSFKVAALGESFPTDKFGDADVKHEYLDRLGRPEAAANSRPDWPVSTRDAIRLLGAAGAVSLGHYTTLFDRHFTFYVDAIRALTNRQCRDAFMQPAVDKIISWLNDGGSAPVVVRYPAFESRPDAAAELLAHSLVQAVRAKTARSILICDSDADYDLNGSDVVHVDWGSITGDSIIRNLNHYRSANAARLLYMTLFCQVQDHLESHLHSLRAMGGRHSSLELDFWFATRLPIVAYPQYQCPVCVQMSSHGSWIEEKFAIGLAGERERMGVRAWVPGSSGPLDPVDLAFGPLGASDSTSAALMRRSELVDAQQSVRSAYHAMANVLDMIEDELWFLSLLTLLLHEPQWLRTPPLSIRKVRTAIASQCLAIILAPSTITPRNYRAKAVIGLRLTSKVLFTQNFAKLLGNLKDDTELEILCRYMCATVLSRDYLANTGLPMILAEQLAVAQSSAKRRRSEGADVALRELEAALDRATALRTRSESTAPLWETLLKLSDKVTEFQFHRVYDSYQRADPKLLADGLASCQESLSEWKVISRWIIAEILPRVNALRTYLVVTYALENSIPYSQVFDSDEAAPLVGLVGEYQKLLGADGMSEPEAPLLARLMTMYSAIKELFDPAGGGSLFLSACAECSVPLGSFIDEFEHVSLQNSVRFSTLLCTDDLPRVLLPSRFRRLLVQNIVGNALKHRADPDSVPDIELVFPAGGPEGYDRAVVFFIDSYGGRRTRRGSSRAGPGGLAELADSAPRGVEITKDVRMVEGRGLRFRVQVRVPTWAIA